MKPELRTFLLSCMLATDSAGIRADSAAEIETETAVTAATELVRQPVIDTVKLDDMRGGLSIAGLDYTIGAVMRTMVDGSVVLESAVDLSSMTGTGVANNFMLHDAKGITEVTHDLSQNHIVATVVNQANQREIQVKLDINITLHNYDSVQAGSIRNRILNSLGGIISP